MDRIDHRVAIVTGGAGGIGAAITTTLARAGYHVAAGYSTNQAAAEQFTGKLISDGLSLSVHKGNVGEPSDCLRVIEEVLSRHGRVDVLVNNAGITVDKTVRRMTVEDWHAVLRVNLSVAFYTTGAVTQVHGGLEMGPQPTQRKSRCRRRIEAIAEAVAPPPRSCPPSRTPSRRAGWWLAKRAIWRANSFRFPWAPRLWRR